MKQLLKPLLLPLLRRRPDEVERQARRFRITRPGGGERVERLGAAFLGGYNAMLELSSLEAVAARGHAGDVHFRPFFFEGAAMGYLPRSWWDGRFRPERIERDLLGMEPAFLYLYYVGLGFWYGFRHSRQPARLEALAPHLDALYFPLCYDGFGFKLGFFDYPADPSVVARLERCPSSRRAEAYQGFGRSMFFVYMDDDAGFDALLETLPDDRRRDLVFGRSLATGFTGIDDPDAIVEYIEQARDDEERGARLIGVTWAMAARQMNDDDYFRNCLGRGTRSTAALLERLPEICNAERTGAKTYADWQRRAGEAVARA